MPHVSKEKLNNQTSKKIETFLTQLLNKATKADKSSVILNNLFTETEKVMLAKRLFIIFMLLEGESHYQIWVNLKVSPSTVLRYQQKIDIGEFNNLKKYLPAKSNIGYQKNDYNNAFFGLLIDFLMSGRSTKRLHQIREKYERQ